VDLATGRDVALVVLIAQAFVLALVPAAAFYYAIRGIIALRRWLEPVIPAAQDRLARVAQSTYEVSDRIVRPIIALSIQRRQVQSAMRALWLGTALPQAPPRQTSSNTERDAT
jgi:hypothetical protein